MKRKRWRSLSCSIATAVLLLLILAMLLPSVCVSETEMVEALDRIELYVEPDLLWNQETGILAEGPTIEKTSNLPFRNAVYLKMMGQPVIGTMTYISADTGIILENRQITLTLAGNSLTACMPQKSLRVDAEDGSFDIPLFEDRTSASYESFLLDNAGEDCLLTRVADAVQVRLIENYTDMSILTPAWKPVTVYLNGEYWGQYGLRENLDAKTICWYEGLDPAAADQIIVASDMNGRGCEAYKQLISLLKQADPVNRPIDKAYLDQNVDVDSFLTWLALKMYFGDTDAAGSFLAYQTPGGKWKCAARDFDYGLFISNFNAAATYLRQTGFGERRADNTIFLKILEIDAYREQFLLKLGTLYQRIPSDVMIAELDACVAWIEPEIHRHCERWASPESRYLNSEAPQTPDGMYRYWQSRIQRMKNVMNKRPMYLLLQTQNAFGLSIEEMVRYFAGGAK